MAQSLTLGNEEWFTETLISVTPKLELLQVPSHKLLQKNWYMWSQMMKCYFWFILWLHSHSSHEILSILISFISSLSFFPIFQLQNVLLKDSIKAKDRLYCIRIHPRFISVFISGCLLGAMELKFFHFYK